MRKFITIIFCLGFFGAKAQQAFRIDTVRSNKISTELSISRAKAARLSLIMYLKQGQIDSVYKDPNSDFTQKQLTIKRIIFERDSLVNNLLTPAELQRLAAGIEQRYGQRRNDYRARVRERKSREGNSPADH